jgi:transposase
MTIHDSSKGHKKPAQNKTVRRTRKPTYREMKADNEASVRTNARIFDITSWKDLILDELAGMNAGKPGRPYTYCRSMMVWIAMFMGYNKGLTFRKAAGAACGILRSHGIGSPHYSTIFRRCTSISGAMSSGSEEDWMISSYVRPKTGYRKHHVAIDSTGLNLSKTTLWRENKWGVGPDYRGWLKMHAIADVDTNEILAYVLSEERVGDNRAFRMLIELVLNEGYDIRTVYADNAYEAHDNWVMLHELNIKFVVRFKSNTAPVSNGCMERGESAQYWVINGPKAWTKYTKFGRRWKVEVTFSDFKRLVAETVTATTRSGMECEVVRKVLAFNFHKRIRADVVSITGNDILVAED